MPRPGLAREEWAEVQRHPVVGYDLLVPLRTFGPVLPVVRWHHERPNGTGCAARHPFWRDRRAGPYGHRLS